MFRHNHGAVAQRTERGAPDAKVAGSIPASPAIHLAAATKRLATGLLWKRERTLDHFHGG